MNATRLLGKFITYLPICVQSFRIFCTVYFLPAAVSSSIILSCDFYFALLRRSTAPPRSTNASLSNTPFSAGRQNPIRHVLVQLFKRNIIMAVSSWFKRVGETHHEKEDRIIITVLLNKVLEVFYRLFIQTTGPMCYLPKINSD